MKILLYNELNTKNIPNFKKIKGFLEADDFRSAQVKKVGDNLYRARLDKSNRLLFAIHRYRGEPYALVLEWIRQHAYDKSRFLGSGAVIDEEKIPVIKCLDAVEPEPLIYVNPHLHTFNLLDKVISFDEAQASIYRLQPPLIVIGSAGSGKTVLTLEKMKEAIGDVLYVTRSAYLVHNSRDLYYALGYENEDQTIDFLSFQEYLESIHVPPGRELTFREFGQWHGRQRVARELRDAHQLFEEFKGVLTGPATDAPYLSREEYLGLGIKQSIFSTGEREKVYDLFGRYRAHMVEQGCYDANILSYEYMERVVPGYDFVVVDEVQDLTNIQLQLVLKSLREPHGFVLCGDSNQIVHPNFFSWSKLKSYFYRQEGEAAPAELIRILDTNYRNSPEVTEVANRVLKIKNARFGSIDKESNYLVRSNAHNRGVVVLLRDDAAVKREIDRKTRTSTRFAIIVMHPEQKALVKQHFGTPLVFSIQEAKGLEYENVVLYNFTSNDAQRFREIARGVAHEDLLGDELAYARARDKGDKSLEIYKFHINALYVAITRAVKNIYLIEGNPEQPLFDLLGLQLAERGLKLEEYGSSLEEWRAEARRLELQGKQEQADEIRSQILRQKAVPWQILQGDALEALQERAVTRGDKKAKLLLFEYALVYRDQNRLNALIKAGFAHARSPEKGLRPLNRKHYLPYELKHPGAVLRECDKYGADFRNPFNQTPLMIASRLGNATLVEELIAREADTGLVNNVGLNAFRIALEQACGDPKYAKNKLTAIYQRLEPDSTSIQVDGRLVKLDNHLMEFLMLNLTMVLSFTRLARKVIHTGGAFESADFVETLAEFPDSVVPERRKKRAYISSILAKNEVSRDDRYNRKLFYRIKRGHYIINPNLSVRVEGEWRNIYTLLPLELIAYRHIENDSGWRSYNVNEYVQDRLTEFREHVKQLIKR
ncbi:MAG: AAA family ATPase [Pseudomonadota bacterium]|nr:AAA family ATPase [Pseudomonadota bacterium]